MFERSWPVFVARLLSSASLGFWSHLQNRFWGVPTRLFTLLQAPLPPFLFRSRCREGCLTTIESSGSWLPPSQKPFSPTWNHGHSHADQKWGFDRRICHWGSSSLPRASEVNVAAWPRTHILLKQLNIKLNISENTTEDELIDELKVKEEQIFKWVVLQVITNLNLLGN